MTELHPDLPHRLDPTALALFNACSAALPDDAARFALRVYVSVGRMPVGVLLTTKSVAEGMTTAPLGWHRVGHALVEMMGAGREFSGLALRRFAEKVPLPDDGLIVFKDTARRVVRAIDEYDLTNHTLDATALMAAFRRAVADGAFASENVALMLVASLSPTGLAYRGMATDAREQRAYEIVSANPGYVEAFA